MISIDASIAAKWFLPEGDREAAKDVLRQGHVFIAPPLIRVEVAAAITKASRLGYLKSETSRFLCEKWFGWLSQGIIKLEENHEDYFLASKLASDVRHPYQDCLYIAMAKRCKIPLLSADEKQSRTAERAGIEALGLRGDLSDRLLTARNIQ